MLEVLDTLIKRDKIDLKRYNQKHLEASAMYQGKVWLMPKAYTGNALSMAVNVDLFKQAGVALPSADANRSWTWAEFVETLVKLTRTGPDGEVAQFGLGNFGSVHFTWPLLWDGDWISADLKTATCDSAAMQECYTRFFELPHRYHVLPRPGEATRLFGNANLFTTGKAAVYIVPPWALPQYTQTKTVELTFVPMPRGRRSTPDITLDSLGIPKGVKEVEAAWHFTKWLSEGSRYAKYVGKLPAELSQIEPWVQEQFGIYADPRPQVVTSAIEHGVAQVNLGRHPKFPLLSNLIVPGLNEQVWTQQVAPADFLKAIKPQVQDILDGKAG
ncbi:MAG: extracellular solute-binding protein [Chloroflexota bacterium]